MTASRASGNEQGFDHTSVPWYLAMLRWTAVLAALWLIGEMVHFARLRLPEPYPLRWLESYLFRSALEAYRGGALYPEPSIDYIAPIYQPMYFILGGWAFKIFGASYTVLRAISFGAFAGCVIAAFAWLRHAGQDRREALAFASLLLLIPRALNSWMTTANLDAPFFLLVVLALLLLRFEIGGTRSVVIAALLLAAAFTFKQQALPFAIAASLYAIAISRRHAVLFVSGFGLLVALWMLCWHLASDGWSTTITLGLPLHAESNPAFRLWDWIALRLPVAGVAFAVGVGGLALKGRRRAQIFWILIAVTALLVTWLSGRKSGGTINNLLPYMILSFVAAGEAFVLLRRRFVQGNVLLIVVVFFLGQEAWQIRAQNTALEHAHSVAPGASAYARIEAFESRLLQVVSGYVGPVFVGGRPAENFHQTALYEGTIRTHLYHEEDILEPTLEAQCFDALLIWEREEEVGLHALIERHYEQVGSMGRDPLIGLNVQVWEAR